MSIYPRADFIAPAADDHYLKQELDALFRTDDFMWSFVQQGSLDGVWYWDLEKPDNEWMSPEMWRLLGIDPATKSHNPSEWQDLIFPEDLAIALENFDMHCADPSHPFDQIVRYRHADGSVVWVRCRGIAIRDKTGKPIRMLGAHNDYTQIKTAEEEARAAERAMSTANAELRNFAYSISHDLKSPTNTVGMILQEVLAVDRGQLNSDQHELIEMAQHTVDHMRRLVDDLLSYTRMIGQELPWEHVDLSTITGDLWDDLGALIRNTDATLKVGALPVLPVNAQQIRALFQNLIENAIKYRHPDRVPMISIETGFSDFAGMVEIRFTDNGIGIEAEYRDRIFEMFKRLHRADEVAGAGLCRRIVANHGGEIRVSSVPGEGSTFSVLLPRYRQ